MEGLPLLGAVLFCHSPVFSRSSPLRHRALGGLRRRLLDTDGATMVRPPTPRLDPRTRTPHARLLCIHSATSAPCPRSGSAGAKYARCSVVCAAAALRDAVLFCHSPCPRSGALVRGEFDSAKVDSTNQLGAFSHRIELHSLSHSP